MEVCMCGASDQVLLSMGGSGECFVQGYFWTPLVLWLQAISFFYSLIRALSLILRAASVVYLCLMMRCETPHIVPRACSITRHIIVKHEHLQASCFCTFTKMDLSGFGSAAAVVMWYALFGCIFLIHACYVCQLCVCTSHELEYLHTSVHRNWWYLKMFGVVSSHFAYFKPFRVLLCVRGNVSVVCLCTNFFLQCICRGTTTLVCS